MRANCNIAKLVHHQNWNYLSIVQVIGYSSNLTLFISPSTVGQYTCHVTVPGYKIITSSAHVWARGPPEMVLSAQSRVQHGSLGETVQVQCEARSVPQASRVVWKYKDYPVNTRYEHWNQFSLISLKSYSYLSRTQHYQVITKKNEDRVLSTLVIRDSVLADFGVYNCSVQNSHGESFQLIDVVRKGQCHLSINSFNHHTIICWVNLTMTCLTL